MCTSERTQNPWDFPRGPCANFQAAHAKLTFRCLNKSFFREREGAGAVTFSLNCPFVPPPPGFAYVILYMYKLIINIAMRSLKREEGRPHVHWVLPTIHCPRIVPLYPPPPGFSHVSHYMCKWLHFGLCVYSIQPSLQKRAYYFFSLSFETWGKAHGGQAGVRHDIMYMTLCTYLSDYNTSIIVQYSSTRVLEYSSTAVSIHNKNKLLANCEDRIGSSSLFIKYYRYRYIRAQSILEPRVLRVCSCTKFTAGFKSGVDFHVHTHNCASLSVRFYT